jgi:hypothetical protein
LGRRDLHLVKVETRGLGQICGEELRMPWDLVVSMGAGRADRHHSGVTA